MADLNPAEEVSSDDEEYAIHPQFANSSDTDSESIASADDDYQDVAVLMALLAEAQEDLHAVLPPGYLQNEHGVHDGLPFSDDDEMPAPPVSDSDSDDSVGDVVDAVVVHAAAAAAAAAAADAVAEDALDVELDAELGVVCVHLDTSFPRRTMLDPSHDTRAFGFQANLAESVGKTWTVHDNGGRPFCVRVTGDSAIEVTVNAEALEEGQVAPEPLVFDNVQQLWVGCTPNYSSATPDATEDAEGVPIVVGATLLAVLNTTPLQCVTITNCVSRFTLGDGETVDHFDGGDDSSDVWYSSLVTSSRNIALIENKYFSNQTVDASERHHILTYGVAYARHGLRDRAFAAGADPNGTVFVMHEQSMADADFQDAAHGCHAHDDCPRLTADDIMLSFPSLEALEAVEILWERLW